MYRERKKETDKEYEKERETEMETMMAMAGNVFHQILRLSKKQDGGICQPSNWKNKILYCVALFTAPVSGEV